MSSDLKQKFFFEEVQRYAAKEIRDKFGVSGYLEARLYTLDEVRVLIEESKLKKKYKRVSGSVDPCTDCPLKGGTVIESFGDLGTAKVAFIGRSPGATEIRNKSRPFDGEAGDVLSIALEKAGMSIESSDVYLANVIRCRPLGDIKPEDALLNRCSKHIIRELEGFKGLIVLLGAEAIKVFLRRSSVRNAQGFGFTRNDQKFFATYNPAKVFRDDGKKLKPVFEEDIRKVGVWKDIIYNLSYETLSKNDIDPFISHLFSEYEGPVAFDIETTGLDPFAEDARVLSIALSYGEDNTYFILLPIGEDQDIINSLKPIFSNKNLKLVGQHGKFDLNWLRVHYDIECSNYWFDTKLAHFLLEGKQAPSRLKEMVWKYTDYGGYDSDVDVSKLAEASTEELGKYNAMDAFVTFELMKIFKEELTSKQLELLTEIMCPSISAFSEMEMGGLKIDYHNLEEFSDKCRNELSELEQKLHSHPVVVDIEEENGVVINLNSSDQLVRVLKKIGAVPKIFTKKKQQISTTEKALKTIKPCPKFVEDLLKYKKQNKLYSTYLSPYLKDGNWWSKDGLARGDYDFDRTNTGRTACRAPNLQNIPYPMRPIFTSKYGWFVEADYSQLELRVIASLSNEQTLIAEFNDGKDAHELTREIMFGDNSNLSDTKKTEQRKKAKGVNFAVIYGTTKYGLAENLKVSQVKAQAWIDAYYEKYPAIAEYQQAMIKFAKDNDHIETPFGRKRYFNFKRVGLSDKDIEAMYREIKNTLPQSTASDVVVLAAGTVWQMMRSSNMKSRLVAYIHDNIMVDMVEDEVEDFIPQLKVTMEDLEFDWLKVPLVVDIKVGTHWGRLEELDL